MAGDEPDGDIGKTIGLESDNCFHIGVIIEIDDATEQVTIRTEEGREFTVEEYTPEEEKFW